ncbi:MAG: hypothetical protein ACI9E5_001010, partial [Candidatus Omnitrophota bacterium]
MNWIKHYTINDHLATVDYNLMRFFLTTNCKQKSFIFI